MNILTHLARIEEIATNIRRRPLPKHIVLPVARATVQVLSEEFKKNPHSIIVYLYNKAHPSKVRRSKADKIRQNPWRE